MRFSAFIAAMVVFAATTPAHAVRLTVMQTYTPANSNGAVPVGYKGYVIGIKVTKAESVAAGTKASLVVQNITFPTPFQASGSANKSNVQSVQAFIDNSSVWPPSAAGLSATGKTALYGDSWWYFSTESVSNSSNQSITGGLLVGQNDPNNQGANQGVVATVNTLGTTLLPYSGGNTTVGPTSAVGASGFVFTPEATGFGGGNGPSGSPMTGTGIFGPFGQLGYFDGSILSTLFTPDATNGGALTLTVPLAYIVTNANMSIPDSATDSVNHVFGAGTLIAFGTGFDETTGQFTGSNTSFDLWGQAAGTDTALMLDFASDSIKPVPEPASLALAGLGTLGVLLLYRRRRKT